MRGRDSTEPPASSDRRAAPISGGDVRPALVRDLFSAIQMMRLRGKEDVRTRGRVSALRQTLDQAARDLGRVRIVRSGPYVFVSGGRIRPLPEVRMAVQTLLADMERLGIGGFEWDTPAEANGIVAFLEAYPRLDDLLCVHRTRLHFEGGGDADRSPAVPIELLPGVRILPVLSGPASGGPTDADYRTEARRTFFRALAGARHLVRHFARQHVPELRKSRALVHGMIDSLVNEEYSLLGLAAIQNFDQYTFQHSVHVCVLSMVVGQGLGLPRRDLADLGVAALFHDIGKVGVPKGVLLKPGRLSSRDWSVMRSHPLAGARELILFGGASELAIKVMLVGAEHHLRFDGSGYPALGREWNQGLFARIVSAADCFDAMTASRVYVARPFTPDSVVRYMIENAGRLFDPDLLRLFVGKVGLFPVGSLVRLESGELALVIEPPRTSGEVVRPRVRLLSRRLDRWELGGDRTLAGGPGADPAYRIQAGCHPGDHGVDVDSILAEVYLEAG
jgi:HD-GYP domain-containing protein (c-di-GMP phosphodiesterase class II)